MFLAIESYTVNRPLKINGVQYAKGDPISGAVIVSIRGADSLLSRKFIIPTPDPHGRKTRPETPTPVSLPATVRNAVLGKAVEENIVLTATVDAVDPSVYRFDIEPARACGYDYGDGYPITQQDDGHGHHNYEAAGDYHVVVYIDDVAVAFTDITVVLPVADDEAEDETQAKAVTRKPRTRKASE